VTKHFNKGRQITLNNEC